MAQGRHPTRPQSLTNLQSDHEVKLFFSFSWKSTMKIIFQSCPVLRPWLHAINSSWVGLNPSEDGKVLMSPKGFLKACVLNLKSDWFRFFKNLPTQKKNLSRHFNSWGPAILNLKALGSLHWNLQLTAARHTLLNAEKWMLEIYVCPIFNKFLQFFQCRLVRLGQQRRAWRTWRDTTATY